ncbi:MAG: hypothetical protein ABJD97_00150, partial [Betaproteobacteria bacterium]
MNALAPMAVTGMTERLFEADMLDALTVERLVPYALALRHHRMQDTGEVIEAGGGWAAAMRWQRAAGAWIDDERLCVREVLNAWG